MPCKIMICGCRSEYQDKTYGENQRVFNRSTQQDSKIWRCTICKNEKSYGTTAEEDKKLSKKKNK